MSQKLLSMLGTKQFKRTDKNPTLVEFLFKAFREMRFGGDNKKVKI